jgi:hypothetical protein
MRAVATVCYGATENGQTASYLFRVSMSGFDIVYQNRTAQMAESAKPRSVIRIAQPTVSVPSDRIESMAHDDSGIAKRSWNRIR